MNNKLHCCLVMVALLAGFAQKVRAAVAFNITPAAVSNTYNGTVTFQVTGLSAGDSVVIQGYLDANTNGTIDAGDVLWQQFQLTDGQQSIFHNGATVVTNFNVPGDTDGTTNATITAKMNFLGGSPQTIAGKYAFRLFSPAGSFTPITNLFTVTNFPYAQSFTGNVVSNGTGTTLPNAIVLLFNASSGNLNVVGGAVANDAGGYLIKAPPGTYTLAAIQSNFMANTASAANLILGSGVIFTTNVSLLSAAQSISGRVVDANNSSLGIAGFLVPVQSQSGLLTVAFTDTNGSFTAGVNADQWKIEGNEQGLMTYGYLAPQNSTHVDTTGGSVSGVAITVPKETAMFYGSVMDNLNHPLTGISLYSQQQDNNYQYQSQGVTDANGNYAAGALAGNWSVGVNTDSNPTNYVFSQGFQTTLTNGQAYLQNFTAYPATNHITGHVSFNGSPVANVQVVANANIGPNSYKAQANTDSNGNYSLNVVNTNDWSVSVSCNGGNNSLDNLLGSGNYQCPNNVSVTINNNSGTADFIVQPANAPLQATVLSMTNGVAGVFFSAQIQATGGSPFSSGFPYGASLLNGSYPPGLNGSEGDYTSSYGDFVLSGTPTQSGTYLFTLVIYDAANNQVTNNYSVTISPVTISAPAVISGGQFKFLLNGTSNQNFTVQMSTNLSTTNWISLFVTNNPAAGSFIVTDPNATNKQRFYRILIGP